MIAQENKNVNKKNEIKIKCMVDEVAYIRKPADNQQGSITYRISQERNKKDITLEELAMYVTRGQTFCPCHLNNGAREINFIVSNSLFLDFDNTEIVNGEKNYCDRPITPQEVKIRAEAMGLTVNIMYYTFSHKASPVPRFRAGFILNKDITDAKEYKELLKGLQSLYVGYTDNAVNSAVHRLAGTNNGLVEPINTSKINDISIFKDLYNSRVKEKEEKEQQQKSIKKEYAKPLYLGQFDLTSAINDFNLLEYIRGTEDIKKEQKTGNNTKISPCPFCNHNDNFCISDDNKYICFAHPTQYKGNNIISYLMQKHNLDKQEAIKMFKYDIIGVNKEMELQAYREYKQNKDKEDKLKNSDMHSIHSKSSNIKSIEKRTNTLPPFIEPITKNIKGAEEITGYKVIAPLLAKYVREKNNYFFVKGNAKGGINRYWYIDGYYKLVSDDEIKGIIKKYIQDFDLKAYSPSIVNNVFEDLKTDNEFINEENINNDEDIINFQNGILRLSTMGLEEHNPKHLCTIQIPCNYSAEHINTPIYDKYINNLSDNREDIKKLLEQYMGLVISNIKGGRIKKALFMAGKGDTGKSQLKKLTEMLIGKGNYTGIDLADLENNRFGTANLYNKRLAGSSDMSYMTVKELKTFKQATGGDSMFAEFKGENGFEFVFNGFLWFCMNELPKFSGDRGDWVYNRIVPIVCNNVIPKEEQDKFLINKLYQERDGIIQKLVMRVKEVIKNNYSLNIPESVTEVLALYKAKNSTVISFYQECCIPRTDFKDGITRQMLYTCYKNWCKSYNNGHSETKKDFEKELKHYLNLNSIVKKTTTTYYTFTLSKEAIVNYGI